MILFFLDWFYELLRGAITLESITLQSLERRGSTVCLQKKKKKMLQFNQGGWDGRKYNQEQMSEEGKSKKRITKKNPTNKKLLIVKRTVRIELTEPITIRRSKAD